MCQYDSLCNEVALLSSAFSNIDVVILFVYLILSLVIGLYYSRKSDKNTEEYFLAGKSIGWVAIGLAIFSTNISSEHFIGLAGSGASRGLAVGQFELMAIFILIFLGWILTPIYLKSGVKTMPEFLEKRFDERIRKFFAVLSVVIYLFTKISVTLFAGGILFYKIFGFNIYTSAVVIVLITGIYSLIGGAKAVIKTGVFQAVVLILGAVLMTVFGLIEVGGISGLTGKLPEDFFNMFKPISDPDFPWTGIIFGAPIIAFWYWCTDQYIVQKLLSAKSVNDARRGTLLTSLLKVLPLFILVVPGLIAAAIFPNIQGDDAYATLLASNLLPAGIKGFVLAGLLAAIMSSLSSVFNVASALYTNDIYKPNHKHASERELVLVGRLTTAVITFAAILCVPLVRQINSQIYLYLQSVQAYFGPPIAALFILGLTVKSVNAKGALIGLIIGECVGLSRLAADMIVHSSLPVFSFIRFYAEINFLHFAIILFVFSSISIVSISILTQNSDMVKVNKIKYLFTDSLSEIKINKNDSSAAGRFKTNLILSAFIVLLIISLWSMWY